VIDLQGNHFNTFKGNVVGAKPSLKISDEDLNRVYDTMLKVEEMDSILYMSQRQGKISFYMTSFGETAVTVGTAAALKQTDLIFPQYREQGSFIWRGFTISDIVNQCIGNSLDKGKGR
jgi:2-oxoisovalerate dehydrogenase E1 component alpha subunit